ncbi:hypothetical protein HID58_071333 [Brassica napus]|uniref:Uncharacterized protein n=1 Tax=Brassica napus TaxID=3708 RepID=A0ABQ7Z1B2_BRANA|nr:hypothetical protein HID58_071333 [Brassica napus]
MFILRQRWWAISYGIKVNKGKERQERYDEQEEEEEKQSKFEQKRKESVKKKAKRESISNAEEEDNEEKEITEDATENIDVGIRSFNDLDSPVNKAGSAGRLVKHLSTVCNEMDIVFVVLGAMSHGKIECDYVEEFVARYPLSATYCVSRICEAIPTN